MLREVHESAQVPTNDGAPRASLKKRNMGRKPGFTQPPEVREKIRESVRTYWARYKQEENNTNE